jgi:hypothetical protein
MDGRDRHRIVVQISQYEAVIIRRNLQAIAFAKAQLFEPASGQTDVGDARLVIGAVFAAACSRACGLALIPIPG